mmetsp:Transcript_24062/g.58469  ORF Transcript_24062/g.58469 Transcript_24062/m.58469 type:complete len:516 (-) Transcript_24062:196-1743(-)
MGQQPSCVTCACPAEPCEGPKDLVESREAGYRSPFAPSFDVVPPRTSRISDQAEKRQHRKMQEIGQQAVDELELPATAEEARRSLTPSWVQHRDGRSFSDVYQLRQELGKGTSACVFLATHIPSQGEVAVKRYLLGSGYFSTTVYESFDRERRHLLSLDHPNIVKLIESFEDDNFCYLVLELCRGGELYDFVVRKPVPKPEPVVAAVLRQMMCGVAAMHAVNMVHRDVKSENFIFTRDPGDCDMDAAKVPRLKLCDFGAADVLTSAYPRSLSNAGTLSYTAPEVYASSSASCKADIWGCGVTLYILLTGRNPFRRGGQREEESTVIKRIKGGLFHQSHKGWDKLSAGARDLVQRMLVVDEEQRWDVHRVLQHTWIQECSEAQAPPPPGPDVLGRLALYQRARRLQRLVWLSHAQACFRGASSGLTADIERLADWFVQLDSATNDGVLTKVDFSRSLDLGVQPLGRGSLTFSEWVAICIVPVRDSEIFVAFDSVARLGVDVSLESFQELLACGTGE